MEKKDGDCRWSWAFIPARISFSTASRVSFVFIIFLLASVVVCVLYSLVSCIPILIL